jgi:pentatricopeptide repeat protein
MLRVTVYTRMHACVHYQRFLQQVSYTSAVAAALRGGEPAQAFTLLIEMDSKGITPTLVTYSSALRACGEPASTAATSTAAAGSAAAARKLLALMQTQGLTPQSLHWCLAAQACAVNSDSAGALQIVQEMRAAGAAPDEQFYKHMFASMAAAASARASAAAALDASTTGTATAES